LAVGSITFISQNKLSTPWLQSHSRRKKAKIAIILITAFKNGAVLGKKCSCKKITWKSHFRPVPRGNAGQPVILFSYFTRENMNKNLVVPVFPVPPRFRLYACVPFG